MRVLVVHATCMGSTAEIAERIASRLRAAGLETSVEPAGEAPSPNGFDAVIVGSAVHGSRWLEPALAYLERNAAALALQPLWLFSSGPVGDLARRLEAQPPKGIDRLAERLGARGQRVFNGALDRRRIDGAELGSIERIVARTLIPEGDYRDWATIEAWADEIAARLDPGHPTGGRDLALIRFGTPRAVLPGQPTPLGAGSQNQTRVEPSLNSAPTWPPADSIT